MIKLNILKKEDQDLAVFNEVEHTGKALFEHVNEPMILERFMLANQPQKNSSEVQNVFLEKAKELGFRSEKKGLFENIPTSNLRPDYYKEIGPSGIIIEVERGKTIMNNMDMLDFWKCHICEKANHLFLFVPNQLNHNNRSKPYDCFTKVSERMAPFFNGKNPTNVDSLWIFGY